MARIKWDIFLYFHMITLLCIGAIESSKNDEEVVITAYWTSVSKFQSEFKAEFNKQVGILGKDYCTKSEKLNCKREEECPEGFTEGNLFGNSFNVIQVKSNVNITVTIQNGTGMPLKSSHVRDIFKCGMKNFYLYGKTGVQIIGVGGDKYDKKADNPNNWIIIGVVCAITIVLVLVTIYLVKFKVNPADEHFEQLQEDGDNKEPAQID